MSKDCGHYVYQCDYEASCPICQIAEIERLRARIAELELRLAGHIRCPDCGLYIKPPKEEGTHIITSEQIDAAWTELGPMRRPFAEYILREYFGIVRCEGCWDCADAGGPQDGVRCNGHGWIKTSVLVNKCGQFGTKEE